MEGDDNMDKVYIVYILYGDGAIDLEKVFSTEEKAKGYIDSKTKSKAYEMYWEEVKVE